MKIHVKMDYYIQECFPSTAYISTGYRSISIEIYRSLVQADVALL